MAIALVYILKYSKTIKQFVLNNVIVAIIYGIPAILNFFAIKILFKASRVNGQFDLVQSLKKIYLNSSDMIKYMYNLYPKYLFIFAILFTFIIFCCKIWKEDKKFLSLLKFFYIIIGVLFTSIAPQILQPTNAIWFVPRATYSFASLYGILVLYISINYKLGFSTKTILTILIIIILGFQFNKFIQIEKDRYILNGKDKQITMQIIEQINQYELNTGNVVTQIAIYQDGSPSYTYSGIFATGDINVKCYANDWSTVQILNYYLKRNLDLIEKDEYVANELLERNWDEFNLEQLAFEGEVLVICNY